MYNWINKIVSDGEYCSMKCPHISYSDKDQCWVCGIGCFLAIHNNIPMRHPKCLKAKPTTYFNITGDKK